MNLLSLMDWKKEDLTGVLDISEEIRGQLTDDLKGKTAAMLFEKPSTRTRVSFEVGIHQMGGHPMYMDATTTQLSRGESVRDMASVMSRYVDLFIARVNSQKFLDEFAEWSGIPVINALSDLYHPCQALADVLTICRSRGPGKMKVAFVGDGNNNVTHSLMLASSLLGYEMWVASPGDFGPDASVVRKAVSNHEDNGGGLNITDDAGEAVRNADVITTDVWVSMGREDRDERIEALTPYQVNASLVQGAKKDFIFLHCLPAHVGQEVTGEVIYGKNSLVFDQAENRLHAQKGLMRLLMSKQI